jgi:hypothetical protein
MTDTAIETALDPESIEANRRGQLSPAQIRHVYGVGVRSWVINAMLITAVGVPLTFAIGSLVLQVPLFIVIALVDLYMIGRSYDCLQDSRGRRVAAVTGRATPLQVEAGAQPLGGLLRGDAWRRRIVIAGFRFWLPSRAEGMLAEGDITVYFAPRSRVVVNVEPVKQ